MPESLQDTYAPASVCFGCGPANKRGLRIKSRVEGDRVVCDWTPEPYQHAFGNILNGGIIGAILDCHSNWTAAEALMRRDDMDRPPPTVTAEFTLKLLRPTPVDRTLHLEARVLEMKERRAVVAATLEASGEVTAEFKGTFVAVRKDHPAVLAVVGRRHRTRCENV